MEKVGIITKYNGSMNYGGLLQAYALTEYLNKNDYDVFQICYNEKVGNKEENARTTIRFKEASLSEKMQRIKKRAHSFFIKALTKTFLKKVIHEREKKISVFRDAIPHTGKIYNNTSVIEANGLADYYITGSDRVWSEKSIGDAYFLSFVSGGRKISYAASLRTNELTPLQQRAMCDALNDFYAVSVREKETVQLLSSIGVPNVQWVLDPTFLLTDLEWRKLFENEVNRIDGEYVFCYFLGDDVRNRRIAASYAKKRNMKLVFLPYCNNAFSFSDVFFGDLREKAASPSTFLSLICRANCVITDSFHASVFSIIFHKEFFAFPRKALEGSGTRIESLVNMLGLEKRFCQTKEKQTVEYLKEVEPINYGEIDSVLEENRAHSKVFLENALSK